MYVLARLLLLLLLGDAGRSNTHQNYYKSDVTFRHLLKSVKKYNSNLRLIHTYLTNFYPNLLVTDDRARARDCEIMVIN
jgi:hypothetical protein